MTNFGCFLIGLFIPRDEKQLMKKLIQDKFSLSCTSVVKVH